MPEEVIKGKIYKHTFAGKPCMWQLWSKEIPVLKCTSELCGIDSETTLIENPYTWPDVVIAGFYSDGFCQLVLWQDLPVYLPQFLELNPKTKLVFFNIAFDINCMGREILLNELKKEGRMMELSVNYKSYRMRTKGWFVSGVTLQQVVKECCGYTLNKEDGTRTSFTREKPVTYEQCKYLVEDCAGTYTAGKAYNNEVCETDQARASFVLSEIGHTGMLVDKNFYHELKAKLLKEKDEFAEKLKSFGFRIKSETDDMKQPDRLLRLASMLSITDAEPVLKDRKISANWWWLLAAFLHQTISKGTALISDVSYVFKAIIMNLVEDSVDFNKKDGKEYVKKAKQYLIENLEPYECDVCITGIGGKAPTSAKPAIVMCELLVELFINGDILNSMDKFYTEFKDEHEYNLGWLKTDEKKLTPNKFLQKHLRKMMADNPGLIFPYTDSGEENARKYERYCQKKGIIPDPAELDKIVSYAFSKADMWLLEDANVSDPFLEAYAEYKHREKLLSTYVTDKHIAGDGRVHPKFNPFLKTGRTGCSGPNLQNLPKEQGLREMYTPSTGCVLLSCDYGQEEIATLAATLLKRYGKSRLAEAVNAGVDVHSYFSLYREHKIDDLDLTQFSPETVAALKERSKPYKEDKVLKKSRGLSKVFNFGCGGGMRGATMYTNCRRQDFKLTLEEATQYCDIWANTWPEVNQYFNAEVYQEIPEDEFLVNKKNKKKLDFEEGEEENDVDVCKGKVKTFRAVNNLGMVRVGCSRNSALNFPFQSLAAMISKRAFWYVYLDSLEFGYKVVNEIHDEIICEVPENIAAEVSSRVERLMLKSAAEIIPGILIKAEPALMRKWSKNAEPAFNKEGKLIPFEDAEEENK